MSTRRSCCTVKLRWFLLLFILLSYSSAHITVIVTFISLLCDAVISTELWFVLNATTKLHIGSSLITFLFFLSPPPLSVSLYLPLSLCLSVSLSLSISISISIFIFISLYLSITLIVCFPLSRFLSVSLCLSLSPSLSVCLSVCLSVYLPLRILKTSPVRCKGINVSKNHMIKTSHPSPLGAYKTASPFMGSKYKF